MNKALEAHTIIATEARTDPRYPVLVAKLRKQTGLAK
jgi:hypothetical protein